MQILQEVLLNHGHLQSRSLPWIPNTSSSTPFTVPSHLPTYGEAIASNQGIMPGDRIPSEVQNVLHHIDYSSNPEEARIHFELTSPSRLARNRDQHGSPQRSRRRSPPQHPGVSHYHYYHGDIKVRQPPSTTDQTTPKNTHKTTTSPRRRAWEFPRR